MTAPLLVFAHVGDLHLTDESPEHAERLGTIVDRLNGLGAGLEFAFLPGDNANNGSRDQYAQLRKALDRLQLPVHVIPGDHDMEGGSLKAFYDCLGARTLPYGIDAGGFRCLFLDMSGPGTGGPDFRLGAAQLDWLDAELTKASTAGRQCAVFMHTYPADLAAREEARRAAELLHRGPVRLVEMGHTHYNELANDGRTIYAAARSTGQIEEGPPGFAIGAIDDGIVSWRFQDIQQDRPFVLVTSPADRRLAHDVSHVAGRAIAVRALALGLGDGVCRLRFDNGPWLPMQLTGPARWTAAVSWPAGAKQLTVRAERPDGTHDDDSIEPCFSQDDIPRPVAPGSDRHAIGAWQTKGLLGSQLGPNRNGRAW